MTRQYTLTTHRQPEISHLVCVTGSLTHPLIRSASELALPATPACLPAAGGDFGAAAVT